MKKSMVAIALLISLHAFSQGPDLSARCKEQMAKLAYFVGDWKGEAIHKSAKGPVTVMQQEHIESRLQGMVLAIEGTGRQKNESTGADEITFQAFALVNYDARDQEFKWKSFVKEGYSTTAYFKVIGDNKFEWGFDIPTGGKTRYIIVLDPAKKTWHETGEYSKDASNWMNFIELNLVKQND